MRNVVPVRNLKAVPARLSPASWNTSTHSFARYVIVLDVAGDAASAKDTAEQPRNALEQLYGDQPDTPFIAAWLSRAHAVIGAGSQPSIPKGERSGPLTRIATTGQRFVVHADGKLTAFLELESVISGSLLTSCNGSVE